MTVASRYDVVVAGGGLAGALTALTLSRRGIEVLLVESDRLGGGQSGQSHGYLHRGYAFGPNEDRLPAVLARAGEHWAALTEGLEPVTRESVLSFSNTSAVRRAEGFWRASGLPVEPVRRPGWLGGGLVSSFRSEEATYDFGPVLRGLAARIAATGTALAVGRVDRIIEEQGGVRAELTTPDGRTETILSRAVVLAAGAGTPGILGRSGLPPVVRCRKAFMLVLRGELPVVSAVFPEYEEHGLFLAGRTGHESGTTWLLSDFHSFDSAQGSPGRLAGWWARRMLSTLTRVVDPSVLAGVCLVSGYQAVKSGLAPVSGTVAHEVSQPCLGGLGVTVSPSKLTLAPLAAESAVRAVSGALGARFTGMDWDRLVSAPPMAAAGGPTLVRSVGEAWESDLDALKDPDLANGLPGIRELSSLYDRP